MAPSELLNHYVPVDQHFPDMHGMVAPDLVILNALIFRIMLLVQLGQKILNPRLPLALFLLLSALIICAVSQHSTLLEDVLDKGIATFGEHFYF